MIGSALFFAEQVGAISTESVTYSYLQFAESPTDGLNGSYVSGCFCTIDFTHLTLGAENSLPSLTLVNISPMFRVVDENASYVELNIYVTSTTGGITNSTDYFGSDRFIEYILNSTGSWVIAYPSGVTLMKTPNLNTTNTAAPEYFKPDLLNNSPIAGYAVITISDSSLPTTPTPTPTPTPSPSPSPSPSPTPTPLVGDRTVDVRDWLGGFPPIDPKASYVIEDLNTSAIATGDGDCQLTAPKADYLQIGYTSMLNGHQFYHFMSPWDSLYHSNESLIDFPAPYNDEYFLIWTNYTMIINANASQCSSIYVADNTNGEAKNFTVFPSDFTFFPNDTVSVNATALPNHAFYYWDSLSHTTQPYSAVVYANLTRTAYFDPPAGGGGGGGGGGNSTPKPSGTGGGGSGGNSTLAKKIVDFINSIPPWAIWGIIAVLLIAGVAGVLKGKKRGGGTPSRPFNMPQYGVGER